MDRRFCLIFCLGFVFLAWGSQTIGLEGGGGQIPAKDAESGFNRLKPDQDLQPDRFNIWLNSFRQKALAAQIRQETLDQALTNLLPDPTVLRLSQAQPEFSKPLGLYLAQAVSPSRIANGRSRYQAIFSNLQSLSDSHGVPPEILVAIWGMESDYGRFSGNFDLIRSLATLAMSGHRSEFFENELIAALQMLDRGLINRSELVGSWAGALGQTQILPSDYLNYGRDGDGDGLCTPRRSSLDALASSAEFLQKKAHWQPNSPWLMAVRLPGNFDFRLADSETKPLSDWLALGITPLLSPPTGQVVADQADLRQMIFSNGQFVPLTIQAKLLLPTGAKGPVFLAFPNFQRLFTYNASQSYVLAISLLADQIAGRATAPLAWPNDPALSLEDRMAAQQALAALGFDPGPIDGFFGAKTKQALKAWQIQNGLVPDGYLNLELVTRLKNANAAPVFQGFTPQSPPVLPRSQTPPQSSSIP